VGGGWNASSLPSTQEIESSVPKTNTNTVSIDKRVAN
jgi:hypothetical protein